MAWPDVIIGAILLLGTFSGFRRGFIGELSGMVAFAAAIAAAFAYSGNLDTWVGDRTHLGPGPAHVVAMIVVGIIAYTVVLAAGAVLSGIAKLPILGLFNAVGGAAIGLLKSVLVVWVALYVALFFPLPSDVREQLRHSTFVALIQTPNERLDAHVRDSLPAYVKPMSGELFDRHHV